MNKNYCVYAWAYIASENQGGQSNRIMCEICILQKVTINIKVCG